MWIGIRGAASRLTFKWFLSSKSRRRWLQRVLQGYKISSPEAQESLDGQGNYLNWFTFTELHICEAFQCIFDHKIPSMKENGRPTLSKRTLSFFLPTRPYLQAGDLLSRVSFPLSQESLSSGLFSEWTHFLSRSSWSWSHPNCKLPQELREAFKNYLADFFR